MRVGRARERAREQTKSKLRKCEPPCMGLVVLEMGWQCRLDIMERCCSMTTDF